MNSASTNRVRIDKWLWAARFFKTRSVASRACELGRIRSGEQPWKPSREVRLGDSLHIKNDFAEFEVEVLVVSELRGPAALAQTYYRETDESQAARQKIADERKAMHAFEPVPDHKPSKRDRRDINRFRGRD